MCSQSPNAINVSALFFFNILAITVSLFMTFNILTLSSFTSLPLTNFTELYFITFLLLTTHRRAPARNPREGVMQYE